MFRDELYFKIFLLLTLIYLGFQLKPWTNIAGGIYSGDDNSYYGYVSSIVNDFDFDFSNNDVKGTGRISPLTGKLIVDHPIGTSILLLPFYIVAKPLVLISHWATNTPFDQRHTLFFMFMCSGILLYAYLGGYFLYKTCLSLNLNKQVSFIAVMAIIWGTILPVYIFKRPIFSHVPSFFLVSLLLYFVAKWRNESNLNFKNIILLGLISGGILITRWDDIFIAFFVTYLLLMRGIIFSQPVKKRIANLGLFAIVVFSVFFFTQGLAWKYFLGSFFKLPYNPITIVMPRDNSFSNLAVCFHIFVGLDWGIIYTMLPFAIGGVSFLALNPLSISKKGYFDKIVYCILFMIPFMVILKYRQNGSFYGYRYFLSLLPFAGLGLAAFINRLYERFPNSLRYFCLFLFVVIFFNFLLILPFDYNQSLTVTSGYNIMGGGGWVNNHYVANAIKIYFISPIKTIMGLFARGFVGGYIFTGIYLLFPDFFVKIADMNQKISQYYVMDSYDKWITMFYPFLAVLMLIMGQRLVKKIK